MPDPIHIETDQDTALIADVADQEYYINATIATSGTAIDASAAVTGRHIEIVDGTVSSDTGTAFVVGDGSQVDSATTFKISDKGHFLSGGAGLLALDGGVDVTIVGEVETDETSFEFQGDYNTFTNTSTDLNSGTVTSLAGSAIVTSGDSDNIENTGSAIITAQLTAIIASGVGTAIINDGTATITSLGGSAIIASGKENYITSTSAIEAEANGIVVKGAGSKIDLSGDGQLTSHAGSGIVARGANATINSIANVDKGITAADDGILSTARNATITNSSTITSAGGSAINSTGKGVDINNTLYLYGDTFGIRATGDGAVITNFNTIEANDIGVGLFGDDAILTSKSHITADIALKITGNRAVVTLTNEVVGESATDAAIEITSKRETSITNKGAIHAESGLAIEAGNGRDSISNTGSIYGDVKLGGGNDWFSSLKGEVTGSVSGGKGNDVYVTGIDLDIREKAGQGNDTVQSKFTFVLAANIENLELLGKGTMDATGNKLANTLTGNRGDNHLTGLGGRDTFVFEKKCGDDIITDFQDGKDHIDLSGYKGIAGFSDLSGDIRQSGDDVVIRLSNHDSITLENFDVSHISKADFDF